MLLDDVVDKAYHDAPKGPEKSYEELGPRLFDRVAEKIGKTILECGDRVPIITGSKIE